MDLNDYDGLIIIAEQHRNIGQTADDFLDALPWPLSREAAKVLLGAGKIRHTGGIFRKSYAWT